MHATTMVDGSVGKYGHCYHCRGCNEGQKDSGVTRLITKNDKVRGLVVTIVSRDGRTSSLIERACRFNV